MSSPWTSASVKHWHTHTPVLLLMMRIMLRMMMKMMLRMLRVMLRMLKRMLRMMMRMLNCDGLEMMGMKEKA